MALLSIRDLNVSYLAGNKKVKAVRNVSLDIEKQDSIGIVGESGSGKSTLAMAILNLLPKNTEVDGGVFYKSKNILEQKESDLRKIRWKEMAVVFQRSMNLLSPVHKIGNQLIDVYKLHEPKATSSEAKQRVLELLTMVNLSERVFSLYPHELSGGMMQRVSIALSLIHNPEFLILDEATTALDVVTERQILEELKVLEKKLNITRVMITHDMSVVATSCEKMAVMYAGHLVETGYVKDILSKPKHPYTIGLIESFVSATDKGKEIHGIPGSLPDLTKANKGCIFADRCPLSQKICYEAEPPTEVLSGKRRVSCHLVGGEN